jgi:hypothetical protein
MHAAGVGHSKRLKCGEIARDRRIVGCGNFDATRTIERACLGNVGQTGYRGSMSDTAGSMRVMAVITLDMPVVSGKRAVFSRIAISLLCCSVFTGIIRTFMRILVNRPHQRLYILGGRTRAMARSDRIIPPPVWIIETGILLLEAQ